MLPAIKAAHDLGVYVIMCDYLPHNYAHQFADEYHNVSIIDKEAVLELAQKLHIDGIMSYATDPGVATAAYVAEKMHLPGNNPYESVAILQNKGRFRHFLQEHGFNVPKMKTFRDWNEVKMSLTDIENAPQYIMDITPAKLELGYASQYDYISMLQDFKQEMSANRLYQDEI